jgi:O-antigen ligase
LESIAQRFERNKQHVMLAALVAVSAFIGITAGLRAAFDFKIMFYGLVLSNVLIVSYMLLIRNMTYGLLLYLYSLTFFNFYWRIVLPGRWPDLDLPRLIFVFIWLVFLIEMVMGARKVLPHTKIEMLMLGLVAAIIISMLTNGSISIRKLLNGFAIPFAVFIIAKNVFSSRQNIDRFIHWFAIPLSIYFPINHMFEHYRMTQFVFPRYILSPTVADMTVFWGARTMGVFLQPAATGMAMVSIFVLSLYGLSRLRGALPRIASVFITVLTPVAVFFSYTRSVYLGFASAMIMLLIFSRRLKIYAVVIILAIALGVMANWSNVITEDRAAGGLATKHTAIGRLTLFTAAMNMFTDHPFVGVGFMNFQDHAEPYVGQVRTTLLGYRESWIGRNINMHNHFLNVLTEVGLMGFVPMALVFYFLFRIMFKARSLGCEIYDSDFVVCVWAVFAQYLSNASFMDPGFYEFMNTLPFLLAGIIVGGYQRKMLQGSNNNRIGERSVTGEGTVR